MRYSEIEGFVGGLKPNPTTIFIAVTGSGTWYVAEGGTIVNHTTEDVPEGTWIDELSDTDCFTVSKPINSLEEFEKAME